MRRVNRSISLPVVFACVFGLVLIVASTLAAVLSLSVSVPAKIVLITFGLSIGVLIGQIGSMKSNLDTLIFLNEVTIFSMDQSGENLHNSTSSVEAYNGHVAFRDGLKETTLVTLAPTIFGALAFSIVSGCLTWLIYSKVIPFFS